MISPATSRGVVTFPQSATDQVYVASVTETSRIFRSAGRKLAGQAVPARIGRSTSGLGRIPASQRSAYYRPHRGRDDTAGRPRVRSEERRVGKEGRSRGSPDH